MVNRLDRAKLQLMRSPRLHSAARRSFVLMRYLARRPHDPDFAAFAILDARDGTFLDVGANSGLSALSFRIFNKHTPILSIEANPFHARELGWLKRWLPRFDYRILAASDTEESLELHVPFYRGVPLTGEASAAGHREEDLAWWVEKHLGGKESPMFRTESVRVLARPLDALQLTPSLVKIDVEGLELHVLRGLDDTIRRCHPTFLIEVSANFDDIAAHLATYGYDAQRFDPATRSLAAGRGRVNAFFVPNAAAITAAAGPAPLATA